MGALQLLRSEIAFRQTAIPDILPLIVRECQGAASTFFRQIDELMRKDGMGFCPAVDRLAPELRHFELKWDEIDWIASVGQVAGRYDAATQADRLAVIATRLEHSLSQAQEEYGQKGRLYRALGITAGIMIELVEI